jgi:hypothetical protein
LNPLRHGRFAFMLFSHKVCRWLVPWTALVGLLGLAALATEHAWAAALLVVVLGGTAVSAAVWAFGGRRRLPFVLSLPAFALMGNVAVLRASLFALAGDQTPIWEPTRRETFARGGEPGPSSPESD